MSLQGHAVVTAVDLPHAHCLVVPTAGNQIAIAIESNCPYPAFVTSKDMEAGASFGIPQPHRLVFTSTCNDPAIGAKGNSTNTVSMTSECFWGGLVSYVPHPNGKIFPTTHQFCSIWAES